MGPQPSDDDSMRDVWRKSSRLERLYIFGLILLATALIVGSISYLVHLP